MAVARSHFKGDESDWLFYCHFIQNVTIFDKNIDGLLKYDVLKVNCNTIYNHAQEDANNIIGYKIIPVVLTRDIEISDLRGWIYSF